MIDGKGQRITPSDVGAMRAAPVTYLAEHPPETRMTRPANWRDRVPAPNHALIDDDGIARLPPWLLEASRDTGAAVLTTRWWFRMAAGSSSTLGCDGSLLAGPSTASIGASFGHHDEGCRGLAPAYHCQLV